MVSSIQSLQETAYDKAEVKQHDVTQLPPQDLPQFLNVKQMAVYLQINEKKVYALASEGRIPGTKITGKWLFPRDLVDQWLLESSHGGILTDRLVIAGSDDPLLHRVIGRLADEIQSHALINYCNTGTRLGLSLLAKRRIDSCGVHWGSINESLIRHTALMTHYPQHRQWILLRLFHRQQGIMLSPSIQLTRDTIQPILQQRLRWILRQEGAGSLRFFQDTLAEHECREEELDVVGLALSEHEAASQIAMGIGDAAPGTKAISTEFGLQFIATGWEAFDLALPRRVYFRTLFQKLLTKLKDQETQAIAQQLGGYELHTCGEIVWAP